MEFGLDPKQVGSFEELLMSQVISQEALTKLLVKKGIFTMEEFYGMVKAGGSRDEEEKRERFMICNPMKK
jgi:hypothetical protein